MIKSPYLESVRQQSRTEGQAQAIVQFLRSKFPGELPADLLQTIEQNRDPARLNHWISVAATATSLDEFRRASGI